jgi:hypothetical protein
VLPAEDGVVVVAVQAALTRERSLVLRHAAFAQLARHPRMVIVELTPPALTAGHNGTPLNEAAVAVLTELAYEAGTVDIGLCLVVPPDQIAQVAGSLDRAGVRDLFDLHATVADTLDDLRDLPCD